MSAMRDEVVQFLDDYLQGREVQRNLLQAQFGVETFFFDVPDHV